MELNMKLDKHGFPVFSDTDIIDILYNGNIDIIKDLMVKNSSDIEKFNRTIDRLKLPFSKINIHDPSKLDNIKSKDLDEALQSDWFMPEEYKQIDVEKYLIEKCKTSEEIQRVEQELVEFETREMFNLLRYMIFLVDFMRENNIVWGVGRGSSVASYVLYLIGVHRINSIQYGLDWQEFLR